MMVFPLFPAFTGEPHTSRNLVSVGFEQVQLIFKEVILVSFGSDVVV